MALTPSAMLPLGTTAPAFTLPDTDGTPVALSSGPQGALVIFLCNHCPYVKHLREGLAQLTTEYAKKGIAVFGINSNDVENYPQDSPDKMREEKIRQNYTFPYLFDATQKVAKSYQATCTPDFFLFDKGLKLVYRGQFDDSRPGNNVPVTGRDLRVAMDEVLAGRTPHTDQRPSIGCNIKWK